MKTALALAALTLSLSSHARSSRIIDTFLPKACTQEDITDLEEVHSASLNGLSEIVKSEVLPNIQDCRVTRPRHIYPAVCGHFIAIEDTYEITTVKGAKLKFVVDSSYRSCTRMRVIPMIKEFSFVTPARSL